jgi:hypothetical protein
VSGQAYLEGDVVWSPINYLSYRANTNTSGTTDPSLSANWVALLPASAGAIEAIATGALANGDTVIVNADGTVSVVVGVAQAVGSPVVFEAAATSVIAATYDNTSNRVVLAYQDQGNSNYGTAVVGTVSGTSISFGTPVVFETATTGSISATYDSTNNRVVIAYADAGNSSYGTAIVGTVSGTAISFGTAVVFETASTASISTTYDTANNRVVIAYADNGNSTHGTAIVGTVSGTSISFGTAVVFEAASTSATSTTYDSTNGKVVIAYQDTGNLSYGTAIVGTVSGTSISFGTAAVFESATTTSISVIHHTANSKVVIAYKDDGNSSHGTAIVGTVSGTSISFGTAVVFEAASTNFIAATYDSTAGKVYIAYRDTGNSGYGTAIVGEVSGTSISFGTAVVFESASTENIAATYDSTNNRVVTGYKDEGNSNHGTAFVFVNASTTLTSENYIGISDGAYADTDVATIQTVGSTDDAQSGLTAGQAYYVQLDGSLGLTPASPSVFAGTAISATELIIKG